MCDAQPGGNHAHHRKEHERYDQLGFKNEEKNNL